MRRYHAAPVLAALALLAASTPAAAQGARIHMHGDAPYAADGFLFSPTPPASEALLLIPGSAGVSPAVQSAAQAFMAAGYEVVLLDPNRGGPPGQDAITEETRAADVDSALAFLAKQSNVRPGQIGVLGFGPNASLALRLAAASRVKAAAIEGSDAEAGLDTSAPVPVMGSFALAQPRGPHAKPSRLRYVAPRDPAAADDAALFRAADLATVRRREVEFFGAQLRAR